MSSLTPTTATSATLAWEDEHFLNLSGAQAVPGNIDRIIRSAQDEVSSRSHL
jgi:hypothetical protein